MLEVNWRHLIPLLPLLGAAFCGLAGRWVPKAWVYAVALGAVLISFLIGFTAWREIAGGEGGPLSIHQLVYTWFSAGRLTVDLGLSLDRLSGTLVLVITGVGFLIHLYSVGYIDEDPGYWRYFAYLNLFVAAMLLLVLGDNLVAMFVGWEGVGLCSYLLIGFWYEDDAKAYAGRKAFIVNRIGDFGFLLGIFVLFSLSGSVSFAQISTLQLTPWVAGTAAVLLFIGATGKSAQLPLYVWLPDAMAGPTPVSALIHAATMVTAGVYMIARLSFLFVQAPGILLLIAVVGGATALWAALIATSQHDIKKVLAYSTVSQLGYMFMGVGVGAFFAGTEHLLTHAFFKACLFLGSGAVIHGLHGEQDMRRMGGLKRHMPHTARTFGIATVAITGVLPLSGFWSKDEILGQALRTSAFSNLALLPPGFRGTPVLGWFATHGAGFVGPLLWAVGSFTALLTAFYMWRCYYLTFEGDYRGPDSVHPHESPWLMTLPLWILALLSIGALVIGLPAALADKLHLEAFTWEHFTEGLFRPARGGPPREMLPKALTYAIALAIALGGWLLARRYFARGAEGFARADAVVARYPRLHRALENKLYVDEFYDRIIVRPLWGFAKALWRLADAWVIDGLVNGVGQAAFAVGEAARKFQNGNVQRYAAVTAVGIAALVYAFLVRG
ncbi:MAG: NADH-quinone oxidoreductase subunit L [Myxococcales bacterium]